MIVSFYAILTLFGFSYIAFAAMTDYDFFIGRFSLGLPYAIIGWGLVGLLSEGEPLSFILGFVFPLLSITMMYVYVTSSGRDLEQFLMKEARVTIPILPDKMGEIKITGNGTNDFLVAKAEHILKPIGKGANVRIVDFQDSVALVQTDLTIIDNTKLAEYRSQLYNFIWSIIRLLAPKPKYSGTCLICYGGLIKAKNGVKCPECKHVAHFDHLLGWLSTHPYCPNCKTQLKFEGHKLVRM